MLGAFIQAMGTQGIAVDPYREPYSNGFVKNLNNNSAYGGVPRHSHMQNGTATFHKVLHRGPIVSSIVDHFIILAV